MFTTHTLWSYSSHRIAHTHTTLLLLLSPRSIDRFIFIVHSFPSLLSTALWRAGTRSYHDDAIEFIKFNTHTQQASSSPPRPSSSYPSLTSLFLKQNREQLNECLVVAGTPSRRWIGVDGVQGRSAHLHSSCESEYREFKCISDEREWHDASTVPRSVWYTLRSALACCRRSRPSWVVDYS